MGGRGAKSNTMAALFALRKDLQTAKRNETRFGKAYHSAAGAVLVTPAEKQKLLSDRIAQREAAWQKYKTAQNKRFAIEEAIKKKTRRFRTTSTDESVPF